MVGPDALLVPFDEHAVRTRPHGLGPPVPLQCRKHPCCHGHGSTVEHGYDKTGVLAGPSQGTPRFTGGTAPQCQDMMNSTEPAPVPFREPGSLADQLRLAAVAYLTRFKGSSREHTESDLRCYFAWCAERGLDPLAAQ
jgi:hypothetical protein